MGSGSLGGLEPSSPPDVSTASAVCQTETTGSELRSSDDLQMFVEFLHPDSVLEAHRSKHLNQNRFSPDP